jgi:NAD(P)-dependent dehydrogenase (short-subunit alcohol dehydrogenase family)
MDLNGRRVLITGASSGIGCAAAEAFAREGAAVALLARSREGLERVAARVREGGGTAHVVVCDLGDRERTEAAVDEAVAALGGLDVLVSNAASMVFGRFPEVAPEDFDRTIAITFTGAVNVIRAALPHLGRDGGGAIVATGSVMARVPLPTFISYAAAKHGLRGFLNTLRIELVEAGVPITVSMVHPGPVDTPLWHQVSSATGYEPRNPPDQYRPQEIADALVACARRPRREVTIGFEGRLMELGFAYLPALADPIVALVGRFYRRGREPAPQPGGLWEGQGRGRCDGGLHGRPSLRGLLLRLRG